MFEISGSMLITRCLLGLFLILVPVRADLVAWWTFDDPITTNVADVQAQYFALPLNVTQIEGRVGGGALRFNGTNAALRFGATMPPLTLEGTPYTIAWWQRWSGWKQGPQAYQNVVSYDEGRDTSGGYSVYIEKNSDLLGFAHNTGPSQNWSPGFSPALDKWQHFAIVFNGTTRAFFVDGVPLASTPTMGMLKNDGDDEFAIGALWSQSVFVNFYNGDLDEIQLYRRALSASELSVLARGSQIVIAEQPRHVSTVPGGSATFSVSALSSRAGTPAYQWFRSGLPIQSETNRTITVPGEHPGGIPYFVVVSGGGISLTSSVAVLTTYATNSPGLIARWTFDEGSTGTVRDIISGYEGTAVETISIPGRIGPGAVRFNAKGYIRIAERDSRLRLTNGTYSISWWQGWAGPAGEQIQNIISMDDGNDTSGGYAIFISRGELQFAHNNGPNQHWQAGGGVSGEWEHYCLTFDGATRAVYRNGVLVGTAPTAGALKSDGDDPLLFGAIDNQGPVKNYFFGNLDDVRLYSSPLDPDNVLLAMHDTAILFKEQPRDVLIRSGTNATLSVSVAVGAGDEVRYQWFRNGAAIPGATNGTYTTPEMNEGGLTIYEVEASTAATTVRSRKARVIVQSERGLIAHWDFDDTGGMVLDRAGGFHGELVNGERIIGRDGPYRLISALLSATL